MFVANSLAQFRQLFTQGLADMLAPDEPGAYILALANSLQSPHLHTQLATVLRENFTALKAGLESGELKITVDDRQVFEQLLAINPESLEVNRTHSAGDWQVQYNSMRGLRPPRAATRRETELYRAFDADAFNFNKPFLQPEILWQGAWQNNELRVLYNKFPLAPWHLLIVPDAACGHAQYLTRDYHLMAAQLVKQQQLALPGLYLGYNSLGACASVNHLHFHAVIRETGFPVEASHWAHRGGRRDYPLALAVFSSPQESWPAIEKLHAQKQPYNLLYTGAEIYLLPRQAQNTVALPSCMPCAGWPELCGELTLGETAGVDCAADIERSLSLMSTG